MCELLGISSAKPMDASGFLKEFYSHSVMHPHGWGLMYHCDGERTILREPVRAIDSTFLGAVVDTLEPQTTLLGHIRLATVGAVKEENCHPYTGRDMTGREWTLIHNGTIYSGKTHYQYYKQQRGDTDSERLFLGLLDVVNESIKLGKTSEQERFQTVETYIEQNAPRNKLNLMIWDGELFYVHKNLKNTLSYQRTESGCIFSTQPLNDGMWIPFPIAQVIAFKDGRECCRGERHKSIYVPTLEYITAMDAMHI